MKAPSECAPRGKYAGGVLEKKYEEAAHCWERIRKNLEEEWGYTDGAAIWAADAEKQRLIELILKA